MVSGGPHFRYANEVRNLVLIQLAAGMRPSDIAEALGVSRPFVSQIKKRSANDPEVQRRNQLPKGRPRKLPPYAVEWIKNYVETHPEAERMEIRNGLIEQTGIEVCVATVGRVMKKLRGNAETRSRGLNQQPRTQPPADQSTKRQAKSAKAPQARKKTSQSD